MSVKIDLSNKKGIIFGVANQRSIAWSISEKLMEAGAQLAFTYLDERLLKSINSLLEGNDSLLMKCDANNASEVKNVMEKFYKEYGEIDFIVHSVAFANREDLGGDFSELSKEGFSLALETSSYSLVTIAREASKYFSKNGGSVISMTFDASTRVYPGYNVMGTAKAALENINRQLSSEFGERQIRFNSISAGPLCPHFFSSPANKTGIISISKECFACSSLFNCKYEKGDIKSKYHLMRLDIIFLF